MTSLDLTILLFNYFLIMSISIWIHLQKEENDSARFIIKEENQNLFVQEFIRMQVKKNLL